MFRSVFGVLLLALLGLAVVESATRIARSPQGSFSQANAESGSFGFGSRRCEACFRGSPQFGLSFGGPPPPPPPPPPPFGFGNFGRGSGGGFGQGFENQRNGGFGGSGFGGHRGGGGLTISESKSISIGRGGSSSAQSSAGSNGK